MNNMTLIDIPIEEIRPYKNNPRKNDDAVDAVAESIRQCEYVSPIVVDENYVVLAGHTRLKALMKMGYEQVPCVVKEGLTEEQKKKYRILDNKTTEFSEWDFEKLTEELANLDFNSFDFGFPDEDIDWDSIEEISEHNYEEPKRDKLRCPLCGGTDDKGRFVKVK